MVEIDAIEDIDAFMRDLSSRNKLYKVYVNSKLYKNMELTYTQSLDEGDFFTFRTARRGKKWQK